MKKILSWIFLGIIALPVQAQSTRSYLDSLVFYSQDSLGTNVPSAKNGFTYDSKGNCILNEYFYLNSIFKNWSISSKVMYYYDRNNNDTMYINSSFDVGSNQWVQYNKYVKTFNDQNRKTSETRYDMDQKKGAWKRISKKSFDYDDDNRLVIELYADSAGIKLKDSYKVTYEYLPKLVTKYESYLNNEKWKVISKEEKVLDVNGNATLITSFTNKATVEGKAYEWENNSKQEAQYDKNNKQTTNSYYNWDLISKEWLPFSKYIFTYDDYQNQLGFENLAWNNISNKYESQYKVLRTYDNNYSLEDLCIPKSYYMDDAPPIEFNHMLLQDLNIGYDNGIWREGAPNKYYYSTVALTSIENKSMISKNRVYPNPMKEELNVSGYAEILDIQGRKVSEGLQTIDVSALPKGMYFVRSDSGIVKVIKE